MQRDQPQASDWMELVREKVRTLRFGVVQIVVHDSRVTQIERTERTRLNNGASVEALNAERSERQKILSE